jgi:hypothetical protein
MIDRTAEKVKRGRPTKDPVERLRVKVWYLAVKARKGWSDYRLDQEFAWDENQMPRRGADRLRVFECIRRRKTVPTPGDDGRRGCDLIARVNSHADFAGTAGIFHSSFWPLLKGRHMGLAEAHDFVKIQMERFDIHRPSWTLDFILYHSRFADIRRNCPGIGDTRIYAISLKDAIADSEVNLDLLALVGGMFREAYFVCALETAGALKRLFLDLLDQYCRQDWLQDSGQELLGTAERKILHWQIAENFLGIDLYDDWPPAVIDRPLVKRTGDILDLISRENEIYKSMSAKTTT